jgi:hypothetical protein
MTNREAIEVLDKGIIIDSEAIRSTGYREWCDMLAAIKMGRDALREKVEKERRFVVRKIGVGPYLYEVVDSSGFCMAVKIKFHAHASAIADIYEEMHK